MAVFHGVGEVKITTLTGEVYAFPSARFEVSSTPAFVEVDDFSGNIALMPGLQSPWHIEADALGNEGVSIGTESDARRLARAVLAGDDEAAYLLADEVAMTMNAPRDFVFRGKLLELLKEWWGWSCNHPQYLIHEATRAETEDALSRAGLR